eukprot:Ihof_evm2s249 gene=Ihof_evmTU2s249
MFGFRKNKRRSVADMSAPETADSGQAPSRPTSQYFSQADIQPDLHATAPAAHPDQPSTAKPISPVKSTSGFSKNLSDGEKNFIRENCGFTTYSSWVETIKDGSNEMDKRIMAIGQFRIFQVKRSKMRGTKTVSKNIHLFDIKRIHSHAANTAVVEYKQGETVRTMELRSEDVAGIIWAIHKAYTIISFGFRETDGIIFDTPESFGLKSSKNDYVPGPCAGFTETYRAWCDLVQEPPQEGLLQYIEHKGNTGDIVFDFNEMPGIEPHTDASVAMVPVINTLRHNTYFRSVKLYSDLRKKMAEQLSQVLLTNRTITRVVLRKIRASGPAWSQMFTALSNNNGHLVQVLDLSHNKLSAAGYFSLLKALKVWSHALHTLNLAKCRLSAENVRDLGVTLRSNFGMSLSLRYVDLSMNRMGDIGTQALSQWLWEMGNESQLEYLAMRDSDVIMTHLAPALLQLKNLKGLDVRGCKLVSPTSTGQICEACIRTSTLTTLALSGQVVNNVELAGSVIKQYLKNPKIKEITLSLTGITDPLAITGGLETSRSLQKLDLTGCHFKESDLVSVVMGLTCVTSLEVLILDGCFTESGMMATRLGGHIDGRELSSALSSLVACNPKIHTLSLAGGYRKVIAVLLQPLSHNMSIKKLDISRNDLGDNGGKALASCLRTNRHLIHLDCEDNNFSTNTWLEIRWCLETYNTTLLTVSYPWKDLSKYASKGIELEQHYRDTMEKIDRLLRRNQFKHLGQECDLKEKTSALALTFENDYLPTDVGSSIILPEHIHRLEEIARRQTINVQSDDDSGSYYDERRGSIRPSTPTQFSVEAAEAKSALESKSEANPEAHPEANPESKPETPMIHKEATAPHVSPETPKTEAVAATIPEPTKTNAPSAPHEVQ